MAESFESVFCTICKHFPPMNLKLLTGIADQFHLTTALEAIHAYENGLQYHHMKLSGTVFFEELKREAEALILDHETNTTIILELPLINNPSSLHSNITVSEFQQIVHAVFSDLSYAVHLDVIIIGSFGNITTNRESQWYWPFQKKYVSLVHHVLHT